MRRGPRILLIGGTYRALCVLERLIERGDRVAAFIGQEGGGERDFCPEILEICDRHQIPARSSRKFGEEIVRWLEDRIRPDLAIAVGVDMEIPVAIGGNCRLGLVEIVDFFHSESCAGVALRQRGQDVLERVLPKPADEEEAGDAYLRMIDEMLEALDGYLDGLGGRVPLPPVTVPFQSAPLSEGELDRAGTGHVAAEQCSRLEQEAAAYLDADRVLALSSAAAGFELLWQTMGLQQGDEVICPAIASNAAIESVRRAGARPVFVDVQSGCLTVDPEAARSAVSPRTRAIVVTHPFGQPAELDAMYGLASEAGLEVVEDAGAALGARFGDSRIGRSPCAAVFRLPLAGVAPAAVPALIALPEEIAVRMHSTAQPLRLGDGPAELARARLADREQELSARRRIAMHYSSELVRYDAFRVPTTPEGRLPIYSSYPLRVTRFARTTAEDLHKLMGDTGIETRLLRLPLTARELAELPVVEQIRSQILLLPNATTLERDQLDFTLDALFGFAIG